MWLDNLKELKKEKNMSTKQLAERANLPEKTVIRILSGKTLNPYLDTLDRLAIGLECTIGDILAGTNAVIGTANLSMLQETLSAVTTERDSAIAARDLASAENAILQDKVNTQEKEIELLKLQLLHKDELISVHKSYLNILQSNK
jgi:transcriptional regulator with XRE-family HTH domain